MSLKASVKELGDELINLQKVLREDRRAAQREMSHHGYSVADTDTALEMVKKLIARNQHQQSVADGLRERVKAAEAMRVVETDTAIPESCAFWLNIGGCFGRQVDAHWQPCAKVSGNPSLPKLGYPPCALDEGPILVKKATKDSGGKTEGAEG